jgi:hypothetical protein
MGKHRKDRTAEEWTIYGNDLLTMMGKKHKLYKEIDGLLIKLKDHKNSISKPTVLHALNSNKNELKDIWRKWTQKIKQTSKDAERTKFYIKDSTFENILKLIGITPEEKKIKEISDNKVFKILIENINSYGINNTKEMYDLMDELKRYDTATSERYSKDNLTDEKKGYQGETNKIIHAILGELKRNKINNFEKLKNIRSTVNKELKEVNEFLTSENDKLKSKIHELEIKLKQTSDI